MRKLKVWHQIKSTIGDSAMAKTGKVNQIADAKKAKKQKAKPKKKK